MQVAFNNLAPVPEALGGELRAAVARVLDRHWYVLGPEVEAFEAAFAAYHALPHCVSVANGTDAIELVLRALDLGSEDEVITVAHTAVPTVCAIERAGARPVLVDIDPATYTMDPDALAAAITPRTRAVIPVHLYGHPADLGRIVPIARKHRLFLLEDCAQSHGATHQHHLMGTVGDAAAFSFYPTKNLGAYGDGGAIVTRDAALAERLKRLRNYGQAVRYHHLERGMNSRLDEVQAAILSAKLPYLDLHNSMRRTFAGKYQELLIGQPGLVLPREVGPVRHVYHLYVARVPEGARDSIRAGMRRRGVDCQIHYPTPIHRQPAYAGLGYAAGSLPETEAAAGQILSLPMHLHLTEAQLRHVAAALSEELAAHAGGERWTDSATRAA